MILQSGQNQHIILSGQSWFTFSENQYKNESVAKYSFNIDVETNKRISPFQREHGLGVVDCHLILTSKLKKYHL